MKRFCSERVNFLLRLILRLILTHRYLVLVVFTGQHLHTSRFELSHLFHCGGMQGESFISQVKVQ